MDSRSWGSQLCDMVDIALELCLDLFKVAKIIHYGAGYTPKVGS